MVALKPISWANGQTNPSSKQYQKSFGDSSTTRVYVPGAVICLQDSSGKESTLASQGTLRDISTPGSHVTQIKTAVTKSYNSKAMGITHQAHIAHFKIINKQYQHLRDLKELLWPCATVAAAWPAVLSAAELHAPELVSLTKRHSRRLANGNQF